MVEVCPTFATHQSSKFATTQNKTNYKKDYIYFDTIEQTRRARARERQIVKTVLREGAKLIFFNALRCVIASPWKPTCICIQCTREVTSIQIKKQLAKRGIVVNSSISSLERDIVDKHFSL